MTSTLSPRRAPTTYVLVHGAWHGAWCWERVRPLLEQAGHRVLTPTLTGLAERAHEMSASVGLNTHIDDVTALLRQEAVSDFVLVGHSYAGILIEGVVDRLVRCNAVPGARVAHMVYLDAVVVTHGQRWCDMQTPEQVAARRASRVEGADGVGLIPPPDASALGLPNPADQQWASQKMTAHPFRTYEDALEAPSGAAATVSRSYIDCVAPALGSLALSKQRVLAEGWTMRQIEAGHDCMVSAPEATADILEICSSPG